MAAPWRIIGAPILFAPLASTQIGSETNTPKSDPEGSEHPKNDPKGPSGTVVALFGKARTRRGCQGVLGKGDRS